jgi:hypothetical protein
VAPEGYRRHDWVRAGLSPPLLIASHSLDRCVLSAVLGMAPVVWYSLGGHISEEEMEREARVKMEAKANGRRFFSSFLSLKS